MDELQQQRDQETLAEEGRERHYLELQQANRELLEDEGSVMSDKCDAIRFPPSHTHHCSHQPTHQRALIYPTECMAYALGRYEVNADPREVLVHRLPEAKEVDRVQRVNLQRLRKKAEEACGQHQKVRRSTLMESLLLCNALPLLADVPQTKGARGRRDQSAHFARISSRPIGTLCAPFLPREL
jgi:hypothetical protein